MYKLLLYNILLIGIPAMAAAQEYSYVHYGEKEGLAGNIVYDMTIDNKGFIWFATETGVSRFDGTQFKNFSTKDGLPDNEVLKIYADSKGRIWMAPFINKPVVYENRKFTSMGAPGIPDLLLRNNVISFFEHPDKSIFINYQKNFFRYTTDGKLLQWEGVLPVSASDINTYISMETDSLLSFLKQVPPGAFIGEGALKIPGLDNFSIIAVNRNPDGSFVYTRVPNQQVNVAHSFVNDSLYAYNYKDEQVHFYNRHNGELDFIMQFQKFSKCISDEEGNMWISTLGNGVYRIPSIAFKNHTLREASSVYSIVPFEGKVFTGGDYSQVFVTDSIDKTILYGDYRSSLLANGIYKMTFSNNNRVNAMASYKNKYLYACTDGFVIKLEKGKSTYTKGYFSVKSIDVKDDTLLICTGAIALRANAHDLSFIDTIWRSRTTAGVFYNGAYILGTTAGLMEVKPDRTARALATIDKAFERRITNIRRDEEGGLWIGTSGSGVSIILTSARRKLSSRRRSPSRA